MPRKNDEPETTTIAEGNDAEDPRTYDHDAAEAVRAGELSAAQLPGGGGNVDPDEPDAQYPPGRVETTACPTDTGDLQRFVPDRPTPKTGADFEGSGVTGYTTTDANPDYR